MATSHPDRAVELVTLRLRARMPSPRMPHRAQTGSRGQLATTEKRRVWFSGKAMCAAVILIASSWPSGKDIRGPAIVTEYSATTVIGPPYADSFVDRAANLVIEIQKQKAPTRGA